MKPTAIAFIDANIARIGRIIDRSLSLEVTLMRLRNGAVVRSPADTALARALGNQQAATHHLRAARRRMDAERRRAMQEPQPEER